MTSGGPAIPARQALARLVAGNRRFVADKLHGARPSLREELVREQRPFAIVLGCSDSRVPAEIVFDQGLGDLFVIRVAGNIAAPSQVGSVEYAAEQFDVRLVVVLGHSDCGAVTATLQQLGQPQALRSPNLARIVRWIEPALEGLDITGWEGDAEILDRAVRANIRANVEHLCNDSEVLDSLIRNEGLALVGAEYSLHTGRVTFFDDLPDDLEV